MQLKKAGEPKEGIVPYVGRMESSKENEKKSDIENHRIMIDIFWNVGYAG